MSRRKTTRRLLALETLEDRCNPGGGTFDATTGTFNFTVSMRFNATAAEIDKVKSAFQVGSDVIADATDGQHRFGNVTIVNNSGASNEAEFWVMKQTGRPDALLGQYGVRGQHSNIYLWTSNALRDSAGAVVQSGVSGELYGVFSSTDTLGAGYTVAHEFAHLAYGIHDEYAGPSGNVTPYPATRTIDYSLMDNYFSLGGRRGGGKTYTLNEFAVNHLFDPGGVTNQWAFNRGRSDWAQVVASGYAATAPAGRNVPVSDAPASQTVTFDTTAVGNPYTVMALDRSAFTASSLDFIKSASNLFSQLFPNGGRYGVVSYADTVRVELPPTVLNNDSDRLTRVFPATNAVQTANTTNADIATALRQAADQLIAVTPRSANQVIVLVGGGFAGDRNAVLNVLPYLRQNNISVISVLANPNPTLGSVTLFDTIAKQSGGKYLPLNGTSSAHLVLTYFAALAETTGTGLLSQAPPASVGPNETVQTAIEVPAGGGPVSLGIAAFAAASDITVSLVGPSGQSITAAGPDVEALTGPLIGFRIADPEPGLWTISATAGPTTEDTLLFVGMVDDDPIRVVVSAERDGAAFPAPLTITATPQYLGVPVVGASVSGLATAPDGTQLPLLFFDDGVFAHGDAKAGDGVYSTRFNAYPAGGNGTYTFTALVNGFGAFTAPGEDAGQFGGTEVTTPVPAFSRFANASAVVTGVPNVVTPNDLTAFVATAGPTSIAVIVRNNGVVPATAVEATARVPSGLKILSGQADQGTVAIDGGDVSFDVGTLAPGASATLFLNVLASSTGTFGAAVEVRSANQTDPFLENNEFAAPIPVVRLERLAVGADRGSGLVSAYDPISQQQTLLSAPFGPLFTGGVRVAAADVTGDGVPDTIAGAGPGALPQVVVYDGMTGQELRRFTAFEDAFQGGVYVAVGDFNNDGIADLVVTPDEGGGPRVLIFDGRTGAQLANFFGIDDQNFRGGARAAVGDLDGDGRDDLIVAAGFGGGPRVTGWKNADVVGGAVPNLNPLFNRFVFEQSLRNGTFVAAGDVNGDGFADLIAGGGPGGGPRVQIWDAQQLISIGQEVVLGNFFGGDTDSRGGIRLTSKDVDSDGLADVLVGAGSGAGSRVTAYLGATMTPFATPPAAAEFDSFPGFPGGVFVG